MHESDPLEVARRPAEAYNRRDFDGIVSMYSEGAVWDGVAWALVLARGRPRGGSGFDEFRYGNGAVSEDGLIERMVFSTDIDAGRAAAGRSAEERRQRSGRRAR